MFNYDPKKDGKEAVDLFDILYKNMKFDTRLYKKLHTFRTNWTGKDIFYSEFLGGNTLGVFPIRFSSRDDNILMTDIYNVDINVVYTNIIKLPDIDKAWQVSTNPVLQTIVYTMHRFIVDGKLGHKLDKAIAECYYIFAYKALGSLMAHYFPHNVTPSLAKATYERLSNRFLIKKLGTWNKFLEYRVGDVTPPNGLHVDRLHTYSTNDSVRIVNDLQGRLREAIKYIYLVMLDIKDDDDYIRTTSAIESNSTGTESNKDIVNHPDRYVQRLTTLMGLHVNLIDSDLIYLVNKFLPSSDIETITAALLLLSDEYDPRSNKHKYISVIVLRTIQYIATKGIVSDYLGQIVDIIRNSIGYWSSGSVVDREIKSTKKYIEKIVKKVSKRKSRWKIAGNTTAVIIYLFIRSIK